MKYVLFVVAIFLCINVSGQEVAKKNQVFIRVFAPNGDKIGKGKVIETTDSSLHLKKGSGSVEFTISEIGFLKTKRSNNHNVLIGAIAGSALGLVSIASTSGTSSAGFAAVGKGISYAAAILLPIIGSGIGYLTTLFKKSKQYEVAGDLTKWNLFRTDLYSPQQ